MIKRKVYLLFLAAAVLGTLPATAQDPPPPLASGMSWERQIHLRADGGPFQVFTSEFALPTGAVLDWHDHPGTGVIIVKEGHFTEYKENGCVLFHGVGSVFFEVPGGVHKIESSGTGEYSSALITFFLPMGAEPMTPVTTPEERACPPGQEKKLASPATPSL